MNTDKMYPRKEKPKTLLLTADELINIITSINDMLKAVALSEKRNLSSDEYMKAYFQLRMQLEEQVSNPEGLNLVKKLLNEQTIKSFLEKNKWIDKGVTLWIQHPHINASQVLDFIDSIIEYIYKRENGI